MTQTYQPLAPTPHTRSFLCPVCTRKVRTGDIFCGFCGKPLRVQCSNCGRWTQENHRVCPACGNTLHGSDLSFAQKRELETLQHTLDEIEHSHAERSRHLLVARRNELRTIGRLLAVGMLLSALLWILRAIISSGLSFPGLCVLLLGALLLRPLIPRLPAIAARIYRWSAPDTLEFWREEQKATRARLDEISQAHATTTLAMADLLALIAPRPRAADQTPAALMVARKAPKKPSNQPSEHSGRTTPGVRHARAHRTRNRRPDANPTPRFSRGKPLTSTAPAAAADVEPCIRDEEDVAERSPSEEEALPS